MKIPNRETVSIPDSKLLNYLLSNTHPVGKWKAKFFNSIGFSQTNIFLLKQQLLDIVNNNEVEDTTLSEYGTKYVIAGSIQTPTGETVSIKTVWIIEKDEDHPKFLTAYPL